MTERGCSIRYKRQLSCVNIKPRSWRIDLLRLRDIFYNNLKHPTRVGERFALGTRARIQIDHLHERIHDKYRQHAKQCDIDNDLNQGKSLFIHMSAEITDMHML